MESKSASAWLAWRSDRIGERKTKVLVSRREVAMHHATNTLSQRMLYGALQMCIDGVFVVWMRRHFVPPSTSSTPNARFFNHLDAGPSPLWRATPSYSMPLPTSERGSISFTPFGIAGEWRDRADVRSQCINVTISLRIAIESN